MWSQLLPATELRERGPRHDRAITSGGGCSWISKWKQKQNWLWRSLGKKKIKQNDVGSQQGVLHPGCALFFWTAGSLWADVWNPVSPDHKPAGADDLGWGWMATMWLPLLRFIKNPSYKGKWAQQAGKVSYQGLEEWLEGNRRDFTQTSWHMGVFGYIIPKDRRIPQCLGVFQTIVSPPCPPSPNTDFAVWELLFLLLTLSPWITPL